MATHHEYVFIIQTSAGHYVHGDADSMESDDMERAVATMHKLIEDGDVMHVRPCRTGELARSSGFDGRPWQVCCFNPAHVVRVYAVELV